MRLEREGDMVPVRLLFLRSTEVTLLLLDVVPLLVLLLQVIPAQLLLQGKD